MKLYYTKGYDSIMLALLRLREPAMVTLSLRLSDAEHNVSLTLFLAMVAAFICGAECKNAYALCLRCRLRNRASQKLN